MYLVNNYQTAIFGKYLLVVQKGKSAFEDEYLSFLEKKFFDTD